MYYKIYSTFNITILSEVLNSSNSVVEEIY